MSAALRASPDACFTSVLHKGGKMEL